VEKITCDRCKATKDEDYARLEYRNIYFEKENEISNVTKKYDLCMVCLKKFVELVKSGGK